MIPEDNHSTITVGVPIRMMSRATGSFYPVSPEPTPRKKIKEVIK